MVPRKCFIGVGSPHGDDQIGWLIADAMQSRCGNVIVVHKVGSPLEILDRIDGIEWLGICDGCRGTGQEGDWYCWTWPDERIVKSVFAGSHDYGLTATLDLAMRLGKLPKTVMIWGVEIGACTPGDHVSLLVNSSVSRVVDAVIQEITSSS